MVSSDNLTPFAPESAPARILTPAAAAPAFQETLRQAIEKGLADSRAAYARAKEAADEATAALETSAAKASQGVVDFNTKALDALRANFDAGVDFAKAAINSKTVGELMTLHSDHTRKQVEALAAQAKEFGDLAQKIAVDAVTPIKTQVAKTFRFSA
jgi:phasin